jgi:CelD/BcsL family acetyltransferase involved in cellulose biosynthesis
MTAPAALTEPCTAPTSTAPELSVELVTDYESFVGLEPVWNRLVDEAGVDHPFLRHEWVRTWWDCFGDGKQLHILVVKAGEAAIAIAPLMLSRRRMYGFPVRVMEFMSDVYTERFDLIVASRPEEAYRAIWAHLADRQAQWDVLQLCQLCADSRTLALLPPLAANDGYVSGLWHSANSPYVPLQGTWDGYFGSLDRKHRSNVRNRTKRLGQLGDVALEEASLDTQLEETLEEGFRLEAAAWKGRAGTAISAKPDVRHFYTRLAQRAAQNGWLRLYFLTVNRRKIAFHYSLCYRNKLYLLKPGYDPHYAPYSPSNLLCEKVLRHAFEHGADEYDFLGAEATWKLDWTKETRPHRWLFVFPNRPQARFLHWAKFRLVPQLKGHRLYRALRGTVGGAYAWGKNRLGGIV